MLKLLALTIFFATFNVQAANMNQLSFEPNTSVSASAEADATAFVKMAHDVYAINLDYSDASIEKVELIADDIYQSWQARKPKEQAILNLSYAIGGYVGETFRRNHSAEWGVVTQEGQQFSAMRRGKSSIFFPTAKAEKRIREGNSENLWHYYQYLLKNPG